ncbi:MAG TPA: tetratricopeptide repeat protein [Steroidobacteraceae bacterium]|nr:tetratricopeptide repeat protein [Steroidobacteraceae bacterium]
MTRHVALVLVLAPVLVAGCADQPAKHTLAELRNVRPDVQEVHVEQGLDKAMAGYRRFLEETPETAMTPEAMRRLADLQIEKQFGIRAGDGKPREMAAPERATPDAQTTPAAATAGPAATLVESDREFEQRTTAEAATAGAPVEAPSRPGEPEPAGPVEAIALYDKLLAEYPNYEHNDKVLYQKARAFDELGRTEEALATMENLIARYPHSGHYDEVQFRRGEFFFTRRKFRDAEIAYSAIVSLGASSSYYELALYKLGWTLYKQDFYEEALHRYMALLDHKVSIGYDFDQAHEEDDERRVTDTFRVISLSFSNLGGPEVIQEYFGTFGHRGYEDRVYSNLGEYYLTKLRYDDAAKTYKSFVALYPYHRVSPRFSMRVIEIFAQGGFPKLVLESKQEFARSYGLKSDYWQHFDPAQSPEVLSFLKSNLKDLANHFHAQYQDPALAEQKTAHYDEALHWYGEYLASFPTDPDSPPINYQLADLLLEAKNFAEAARQYEHTAYGYPTHAQSAAAGYAAIFAHRQHLAGVGEDRREAVRRETVASSIRFADTFPQHEHAAAVLGAAADDLFEMKDYGPARTAAQRVVDSYPAADVAIRRPAWIVVAHSSFELAEFPQAEHAYGQVLASTPAEDASRAEFVDHLAASIYKQGEAANTAQDFRVAADHFLRIRQAAPTSTIRPAAEYDAAAALVQLQDWVAAASVLEAFRSAYPTHPLQKEATRQVAFVYRQSGQLARAAGEYDRIATESEDPALRGEALLVAGDLYEQSKDTARALASYGRYVAEFPRPVEAAVDTRQKMASLHKATGDDASYYGELAAIVRADAEAGADRTGRTRSIAARSALILAEKTYAEFAAVRLLQPFETSLQVKQRLMTSLTEALDALVEYEIAEVTAAATFYMAETYANFSRSLVDSQRPADLQAADREEYEMALEEEAFPFEEKAIGVHEKNLELLQAGVFNPWTEKSLGRLAELMPGRYAKVELSGGFLGSMESYAYRLPSAQLPVPAAPESESPPETTELPPGEPAQTVPAQTTQTQPTNTGDEVVAHATHP